MKLTVALGLQYDNNRPASVYALSVGGERTVAAPDPAVEVTPEDAMATAPVSAPQKDRWFALTYNLNGLSVMLPPAATIDLFA